MAVNTRNSSGDEIPQRDLYPLRRLRSERSRIFSAIAGPVYVNQNPECTLPCSNDFRDKQGVLKVMVGALGPLCTIYRVTSSATVALFVFTCTLGIGPYELPSSTRSGQFQKFGKISVGALSLPVWVIMSKTLCDMPRLLSCASSLKRLAQHEIKLN